MKEKTYFLDSHNRKIVGILSDPGADDCVILCHGLGSSKERPEFLKLEESINKKGIATFRIDFFAHGESEGKYKNFVVSEAVDDIIKGRQFIKKRGYQNIGFIGASIGGCAGIIAAARTYDFSFMILISPASNYKWRELFTKGISIYRELRKSKKKKKLRKSRLKIRFLRDYKKHDINKLAESINCPVLIVNGDADKVVPIKKTRELKKSIKNSELKIFPNTDHRYSDPKAKQKLVSITTDFVVKKS